MKKNNIQKMPKAGQAGNGTKPHVSRSSRIAELDWFFDDIDFEEQKVNKLNKAEMLELLKIFNKQMIESTDNWEGG